MIAKRLVQPTLSPSSDASIINGPESSALAFRAIESSSEKLTCAISRDDGLAFMQRQWRWEASTMTLQDSRKAMTFGALGSDSIVIATARPIPSISHSRRGLLSGLPTKSRASEQCLSHFRQVIFPFWESPQFQSALVHALTDTKSKLICHSTSQQTIRPVAMNLTSSKIRF